MVHPHPAEEIKWREVENSSNVARVGWDKNSRMYIEFVNGGIYMYENVSRQRVTAARRAVSVGSYVNRIIIPNYKAIKIS